MESGRTWGHVAIVSAAVGSVVYVMEQNSSPSSVSQLTLHRSHLAPTYGSGGVIGVLHAKANTQPPGGVVQQPPPSHYESVVGDFNGDGLADIGLRDAANGIFYILNQQISFATSFGSQSTYTWAAG